MATFGDDCVGHPGVVHGGVTSLLFDNTLGWANALSHHGGRRPVPARHGQTVRDDREPVRELPAPVLRGQTVVISCSLDKAEGLAATPRAS